MSEHRATVSWSRESKEFAYKTYSRNHIWDFGHNVSLPASAAPEFLGSEDRVDPEQAFVASLSSCHMLTFLALAAKKRFVVEQYVDDAVGFLEKNAGGVLAITRVELRPRIEFGAGAAPSPQELEALHHKSHEQCFIANSVTTHVVVAD